MFSQDSYSVRRLRAEGGAARLTGLIGVPASLIMAALGIHPSGHAPPRRRRGAEPLAPYVEVVTPPGHFRLVSFRPQADPAEL
jgi:hypothetical protein